MIQQLEQHFDNLCQLLFSQLQANEELSLALNSELTDFVRLNRSLIRQNQSIRQITLDFNWQTSEKKINFGLSLTGNSEIDQQLCTSLLTRARAEASSLPEDKFIVPMQNRGTSHHYHQGKLLSIDQALNIITESSKDVDLAGLYSSGFVIRANQNSKGQKHWFATEIFNLDYSLYCINAEGENKAVKNLYAGSHWSDQEFLHNLESSKKQIPYLKRANCQIKPGAYRAYLAPAAVNEITSMFSWNGFSYSALRKGSSAFLKLAQNEVSLSPLFSMCENFDLGITPQFNSLGEISAEKINMVENGKLMQMLTSSRSAKEYSVPGNFAEVNETPRSLEILPGSLAEDQALKALGTGLYLSHLHYLNWSDLSSARFTGMTRYACFWVENGEIVGPIKDMRFDDSMYNVFGSSLEALTKEQHLETNSDTYFERQIGGKLLPGALLSNMLFTL